MDTTLFDIPAVLAILAVVGFVLVRAFGSTQTDGPVMFQKRDIAAERGQN